MSNNIEKNANKNNYGKEKKQQISNSIKMSKPFDIGIKLEPKNKKSEKKLLSDGFYYKVLSIKPNSKVKRLIGYNEGVHLKIKSRSTPVTRWVSLKEDPDYEVFETGL